MSEWYFWQLRQAPLEPDGPSGPEIRVFLSVGLTLLVEDRLRNLAGDDLGLVDRLADVKVDGDARERIRVARLKAFLRHEEVDDLLHRDTHRPIEIEVDAHHDVV